MILTQRTDSENKKSLHLSQIAQLVGGELLGDPKIQITGIAGIKEAREGDITFLANAKYLPFLQSTQASAVIVSKEVSSEKKPLIVHPHPSQAFSKVIQFFSPPQPSYEPGVHATAVVEAGSYLGENVSVGPHVVIEKGVKVGDRTVICANSYLGQNTKIGHDCMVYPNVTIRENTEIGNHVIIHSGSVIGSDGFGYELVDGRHEKIPHLGFVCIEDDVEIGACVCVDRARFHKTWIKCGTKIDNLVQIAHNVVLGENCLIISQAGISGSSELGKNVVVAGQAGLIGHLTLEDNVIVGAGAGVTKSFPKDSIILGSPAKPIAEQKRLFALIARLPELFKEVAQLRKKSE